MEDPAQIRNWEMCLLPQAQSVETPDLLPGGLAWLPADVPGTAASSLVRHGMFDPAAPLELDDHETWYRARIVGSGRHILRFDGLATLADVFVDGALLLQSQSMFTGHDIALDLKGEAQLAIAFRALGPVLAAKGRRARWRPRNITPQTVRLHRTTLIGRMPGWCPPIHAVGPFRDVALLPIGDAPRVKIERLVSDHDGQDGHLDIALDIQGEADRVEVSCQTSRGALTRDAEGLWRAHLVVPDIAAWWPHTHGDPVLHDVAIIVNGQPALQLRAGFRRIALERGEDGKGFAINVNGERIFCRGACWTNADIVALPGTREAYAPLLQRMRDAHMNMVRIGGTMTYETAAFHALCDEFGILVWQDLLFSNFDYPEADEAFRALAHQETREFLARTQASPSLAVLCGGSEMAQQAAMFGLPRAMWSNGLFDTHLAEIASQHRPDVIYVPQTPWGGALPFEPREGLCHYYGVSAYMRPLDDARRADVRFAPETLGHANVPESDDLEFAPDGSGLVQKLWGERFDADMGATWWFEKVRHHYMAELYGIDPQALAQEDRARYLAFSRAANAEVMEHVFGLWRRAGSCTAGAMVWFLRDVAPGAGWGILDHENRPKSVWHALERALRPIAVLLVDDGLNGLTVHLVNETPSCVQASLEIVCWQDGMVPVMRAQTQIELLPRETRAVPATELFGGFFDTTYAYRFGPPAHDVTSAHLHRAGDGALLSEAFHFPLGRGRECRELGLRARVERNGEVFELVLETERFAQSLQIRAQGWDASENWFHLAPGRQKRVRLRPVPGVSAPPRGEIRALNSSLVAYF